MGAAGRRSAALPRLHQLRRLRQLRAARGRVSRACVGDAGGDRRGGALIAAAIEIGRERIRGARIDYAVLIVTLALTLFGVLAVYSASFAFGALEFNDAHYFVVRQASFALLGGVAMCIALRFDYHRLRMLSLLLLLGVMALLVLTLIPGFSVEQNGARRWINLGPLPPLQPSELAKLALIIYIADWLSAKGDEARSFSLGVLPFVFVVGPAAALVMLEPDMGTTIVLLLTTGTQFFIGGASLKHVAALVATGAIAGAVLIVSGGYRADRWMAWVSPDSDAAGNGFHIIQLLIALGSGGLTGVDWGQSRQKFFYIPGAHTDGILAIIGEELGLLGTLAVMLLIGILVYRGLRIAAGARDEFGHLLAVGIVSWIGYQSILNVGGITRTIPMTGIPLPLVSYGGSALIAMMGAIGLLLSISRFSQESDPSAGNPRRRWSRPTRARWNGTRRTR
ncbi:MAG: putative lipid II flippase FtsW, partial [Dehalococcoidia bacterium]|nr:putative lipid II flippase FtsW [Dehalococcoidia bacterium]